MATRARGSYVHNKLYGKMFGGIPRMLAYAVSQMLVVSDKMIHRLLELISGVMSQNIWGGTIFARERSDQARGERSGPSGGRCGSGVSPLPR